MGRSTLTVENGTSSDALVKLVEDGDLRRLNSAFYVRSGERWVAEGIAPGTYILMFALGQGFDQNTGGFSGSTRYFEFVRRIEFREVEGPEGVTYGTFRVTLHRVPGGTARTVQISRERFEAGDAGRT